jgi:hypothetical protein
MPRSSIAADVVPFWPCKATQATNSVTRTAKEVGNGWASPTIWGVKVSSRTSMGPGPTMSAPGGLSRAGSACPLAPSGLTSSARSSGLPAKKPASAPWFSALSRQGRTVIPKGSM